jgi:hypothetical protein
VAHGFAGARFVTLFRSIGWAGIRTTLKSIFVTVCYLHSQLEDLLHERSEETQAFAAPLLSGTCVPIDRGGTPAGRHGLTSAAAGAHL